MLESTLVDKIVQVITHLEPVSTQSGALNKEQKDAIVDAMVDLYLMTPDDGHEALMLLVKHYCTEQVIQELVAHCQDFKILEANKQLMVNQLKDLFMRAHQQAPCNYNYELRQKVPHYRAECFEIRDYQVVLAVVELLHAVSRNGIPEEQAYKLTVTFGSIQGVLRYLKNYAKQHQIEAENLLQNATMFVLPSGEYDANTWRQLANRYHQEDEFFNVLANADLIERQIKMQAETKNTQAHRSNHKKHINVFNHETPLQRLVACREESHSLTLNGLAYFLEMGLAKQHYDTFSQLYRRDDDDRIPAITITGNDIGHEKASCYLMKVPVLDELYAIRAACLGLLTNCSQSLSGDVCQDCVIHGLTSPYGGFYILCEGDHNAISRDDPIIAQAWTWRSKTDAIIFDSIEVSEDYEHGTVKGCKQPTLQLVNEMFLELAEQLLLAGHTHHVAVGVGSGIQHKLNESPIKISLPRERFVDYDSYSDSGEQMPYIHMTQSGFILYTETSRHAEDFNTINKELVHRLLEDENLYFNNFELIEIIETILKLPNESSKKLLARMTSTAKQAGRENEFHTLMTKIQHIKEALAEQRDLSEIRTLIEADPALVNISQHHASVLTQAIQAQDLETASQFIKLGADIHFVDDKLQSPLMLATQLGMTDVVEQLLDRGADSDHMDLQSRTAVDLLPNKNRIEIWGLFIRHGADLKKCNKSMHTLLTELLSQIDAVSDQDLSDALFLIDHGVNVNHHGHLREPLIHQAMNKALTTNSNYQHNALQLVLEMVNHGANINEYGVNGDTALMQIIRFSGDSGTMKNDIIDAMLRRSDKDLTLRHLRTQQSVLDIAISSSQAEIASKLINAGYDINDTVKGGVPPIALAIQHQLSTVAAQIIKHGARLEYHDEEGNNLLMLAIRHSEQDSDYALIEQLINSNQLDLNHQNHAAHSALQLCVQMNRLDILILLVEHGADMNLTDKHGNTALHQAVIDLNQPIAIELISLGAFIKVVNQDGLRPIDLARQAGLAYTVEHLEKPYEIPKAWLKSKAKAHDKSQYTPLSDEQIKQIYSWLSTDDVNLLIQMAIKHKQLLAEPIDTQRQATLLMLACEYGAKNTIEWFIRLVDDPNQIDHHGVGLVCYACKKPHANQREILALLREHHITLDLQRLKGVNLKQDTVTYLIEWYLSLNPFKNLQRKYTHDLLIEYIKYDEATALMNTMKNNGVVADSTIIEPDLNECSLAQYACKMGAVDCLQALLDYRANINYKDREGLSALDYALNHINKNQLDILKILRQARADYPVGKYNPNDYSDAVADFLNNWQKH